MEDSGGRRTGALWKAHSGPRFLLLLHMWVFSLTICSSGVSSGRLSLVSSSHGRGSDSRSLEEMRQQLGYVCKIQVAGPHAGCAPKMAPQAPRRILSVWFLLLILGDEDHRTHVLQMVEMGCSGDSHAGLHSPRVCVCR